MTPYYSGKQSARFWARLRQIKDPAMHTAAYELACTLQSIEWATIRLFKSAVPKRKQRKKQSRARR
jgi:hypothetical protein